MKQIKFPENLYLLIAIFGFGNLFIYFTGISNKVVGWFLIILGIGWFFIEKYSQNKAIKQKAQKA